MKLQNSRANINYHLQQETDLQNIPSGLHNIMRDIKSATRIDLVALYTEALLIAIPKIVKKYDVEQVLEKN